MPDEVQRKMVWLHSPTGEHVVVEHLADEVYTVNRFGVLWLSLGRTHEEARSSVDDHIRRSLTREA